MKRKLLTMLLTGSTSLALMAQQTVNFSMGTNYTNDVYYSLPGGVIKTEPAQNWHLAFTVRPIDASIMINEAAGVKAYLASNNVADWPTLDTAGMLNNQLHNSSESWELGAFANLGTSHPDYGWGEYNQITHNVNASRIFVIELSDGSFRKFIVDEMNATAQTFTFRLADLDGSNEITHTVAKTNYAGKNFFYYDILADQFLDREPLSSEWDLVARRYDIEIPAGPMTFHYIVGGVQTNLEVKSAEVRGTIVTPADSVNYVLTDDDISNIGSDWKNFDNSTFQWSIVDSLSYFVSSNSGGIYHIRFTDFGGSATGDIEFIQSPEQSIGLDDFTSFALLPYPNPAIDRVSLPLTGLKGEVQLQLIDLNGRVIKSARTNAVLSTTEFEMTLNDIPSGTYIIQLVNEHINYSTRIQIH